MRKKVYGDYRVDACPFCGKQSTTKNSQKVPVCRDHKNKQLLNLKCACGDWLDVQSGKYGAFFNCFHCGNISFSKGLEMNHHVFQKPEKKEFTVTSDEIDFI